jgi:hypothetical protein
VFQFCAATFRQSKLSAKRVWAGKNAIAARTAEQNNIDRIALVAHVAGNRHIATSFAKRG